MGTLLFGAIPNGGPQFNDGGFALLFPSLCDRIVNADEIAERRIRHGRMQHMKFDLLITIINS